MVAYRNAMISDLDTLVRLDYLTEDRGKLSASEKSAVEAQLRDYFPKHIGNDFIAWLAETEGGAVATAFLVIAEKPANLSFITGKTGTVMNVFTYPPYRKQGIATQLMQRLAEEARRRGLSYIELSASGAGKPLYERLGFAKKKSRYTGMKMQLL